MTQQPLTLPEVRRIEGMIKKLKSGWDVALEGLHEIEYPTNELMIKALEMALKMSEIATKEWDKEGMSYEEWLRKG